MKTSLNRPLFLMLAWAFAFSSPLTASSAPGDEASKPRTTATESISAEPYNPEMQPTPESGPIQPIEKGTKLSDVQADMNAKLARVTTFQADIQMLKKRDKKSAGGAIWRIWEGPLALTRNVGGHVTLTRKGETEEYTANRQVIWSYDAPHKEARFIPTSTPVIGTFVEEAMRLNVFFSADPETIKLRASQETEGEDCWVLEGKSPARLKMVGVPENRFRVWVAKRDGLPRKIQLPDNDNFTIIMRNIRVNENIPASRYQFTPPEGVKTKNIFGL